MESPEKLNSASEERRSAYARAVLNPSDSDFQKIINESKHSILEIGCGNPPRISWELHTDEVWVGCDPAIKPRGDSILVHTGDLQISHGSKMVVFSEAVEDIPVFTPDVFICVAPNPNDIHNDRQIFNSELEKLLDPNKKQYFVVALDHRTWEAFSHGESAQDTVLEWMEDNDFVKIYRNQLLERFEPNSGDLEADNSPMFFVRNSKTIRK